MHPNLGYRFADKMFFWARPLHHATPLNEYALRPHYWNPKNATALHHSYQIELIWQAQIQCCSVRSL